MYYSTLTTIFSLLIASALSHPKCCDEQNFVINGTCIDGSKLNIEESKCLMTFILENDEYIISENNSLLLIGQDVLFFSNEYCIAKRYGDIADIAIICESDMSSFDNSHVVRAVFSLLSVLFLILTITVYVMVPQLRDLQGKCILHTLGGLATAYFSLSLLQLLTFTQVTTCIFMAFLTYSSFLLAFFWLNVVAFNVWKNIIKPNLWNKKDEFWHLAYCVYAYGMALTFVIVTVTAQHVEGNHIRPQFGEGTCFFNGETATWAYFYGPISVLLLINFVLFSWSCAALWCGKEQQQTANIKGARYRCLMTMKLFFIMGLLWIFEVISYATHNKHEALNILWVITDYVNIIQGVLIFLLLVVFRKKALRGLASNYSFFGKYTRSWQTLEDEECLEEQEDAKVLNA